MFLGAGSGGVMLWKKYGSQTGSNHRPDCLFITTYKRMGDISTFTSVLAI